jgi:hypothetical protein
MAIACVTPHRVPCPSRTLEDPSVRDTLGFVQLILRTILYFDSLKIFLPAALGLLGASVLVGADSDIEHTVGLWTVS